MGNIYCHICYDETDPEFVCDTCGEYYCEQCSYIYSLHYQHQGARCYICSGQNRLRPLDKEKVRERKINIILENG